MLELSMTDWVLVGFCALMVGITKTGVPGLGILVVPLMAMVIPARLSVGVLLGILILADVFAAVYYRRHAQWGQIARLLPAAFVGVIVGYFCLKIVSDGQLKPIIGVIVLLMLVGNFFREWYYGDESKIPTQLWFAIGMGFLAGVVTMMANAAGPVMIIYLLAMRLDKKEFIGTRAWFFFIINWIKVPFGANLELITAETVKLDLIMLPVIAVGAVIGILILKHIPQKAFKVVVQVLAVAAAIKLLF
ncbi:MAG: sulfite exporter TauE/SafE family protein [Planctomycetes bacterium]|nr:sulfite exporter TauE/SafE family protein [Planctomycetota bacterium]